MLFKKEAILFFAFWLLFAGIITASAGDQTGYLWSEVDDAALNRQPVIRTATPDEYKTFRLNRQVLEALLAAAPDEFSQAAERDLTIELPMPDGRLTRFKFEHSLVVERGLLVKYPELGATYRAYGIDDPTATARFDYLPAGFHAMVLSANGTVVIDPYAAGDKDNYVTYFKNDLARAAHFVCEVGDNSLASLLNADLLGSAYLIPDAQQLTSGTQLRTYRLALAATNEYAVRVGANTVAGTLAAQVLIMNRVNGVYERDLAIHMNIVANNNLIIFAGDNMCAGSACTAENDPYSNSSAGAMLSQNTTTLNTHILTENYDIGHVFGTGGGGVASLNGPCGGSKARGVTGLTNPIGDPFAIDYVAHEMGHQWGANHTFNGGTGNCAGGNRSNGSAYEPGSGVTIMGYAGICGSQNLERNSIDTFHIKSIEVILNYSQNGNGNSCAVITPSGNNAPIVSVAAGPFNIPKLTPFALTASASDADGDMVTYDWQQYDLGPVTTGIPNADVDGSTVPLFRPYLPTTGGTRLFPSLTYILNNANVPPATFGANFLTGELLPQISRPMTFQVAARDNRASAGGVSTAAVSVLVDGASGPFAVTSLNSNDGYIGGSPQILTWSVAGTSNLPINAANVKISYSTDGGNTFPVVLHASTPNDGAETIIIPRITTTTARIKVEAVGNIFFDISDSNFSVALVPVVTLSGQVLTAQGLGLRNALVTLTDSSGGRRSSITSPFGVYTFDQVPVGSNYTIAVSSKRYRFASRTVNVSNALTEVNFTGLE